MNRQSTYFVGLTLLVIALLLFTGCSPSAPEYITIVVTATPDDSGGVSATEDPITYASPTLIPATQEPVQEPLNVKSDIRDGWIGEYRGSADWSYVGQEYKGVVMHLKIRKSDHLGAVLGYDPHYGNFDEL